MRSARAMALAAIVALLVSACSHAAGPPAAWHWGLPVYPGASLAGSSSAHASFVLYHTGDPVQTVDAWYQRYLPARSTQHAYDQSGERSTFALFDATGASRTVHIEREGALTAILLTKVDARSR